MKNRKVKELMVPVHDYVTINQEVTLAEAVQALRDDMHKGVQECQHRAILAVDDDGRVVGKLAMHHVIIGLEPGYRSLSASGNSETEMYTSEYIRHSLEQFSVWQTPLEDLCLKGSRYKLKDIMVPLASVKPEIYADTTLSEACHAMLMGHHQSLLVRDDEHQVIGVLRLSDLFLAVADALASCEA